MRPPAARIIKPRGNQPQETTRHGDHGSGGAVCITTHVAYPRMPIEEKIRRYLGGLAALRTVRNTSTTDPSDTVTGQVPTESSSSTTRLRVGRFFAWPWSPRIAPSASAPTCAKACATAETRVEKTSREFSWSSGQDHGVLSEAVGYHTSPLFPSEKALGLGSAMGLGGGTAVGARGLARRHLGR